MPAEKRGSLVPVPLPKPDLLQFCSPGIWEESQEFKATHCFIAS